MYKKLIYSLISTTIVLSSTIAVAQPKYKNLRYQENWSTLKNNPTGDIFDPLKYIPLNSTGDVYLSFGSQLRLRGEGWNNFGFDSTAANKDGDPSRDGVFGLGWLRTYADFHLYEYFRFFAEVKNSVSTPRGLPGGVRGIDMDSFNFNNLFIDLKMPFGNGNYALLRPGRQEMDLGKQRLVSSLMWVNSRRTFDAVSAITKLGPVKSRAFYASLVKADDLKADPYGLGFNMSNLLTGKTGNVALYGLYNELNIPSSPLNADLYWIGLHKDNATFGGNSGAEERQTVGARLGGKLPMNFDFDLEGGYQFGQFSDQGISAYFAASELGHKFNIPTSPRVYLGFDYSSGDNDANDKTLGTFNHLLPLAHKYNGLADMFGRQNIMDMRAGFSLKPLKPLLLKLDGHYFMRSNANDGVYAVTGAQSTASSAGTSLPLGFEIDFTAKYKTGRHSAVVLGLSHLIPQGFFTEAGKTNAITFAYLQTMYTF